jgi:putative inorganic carbon (HCO3(-)) transporter
VKSTASFLVRFEWLLLLLAAPLLLFPGPRRSLALLVVPLLWLSRRITRGRFVEGTPLNAPIALLALAALVSLYATFDIAYSLPKVAGMVLGMGVYAAVVGHASDRRGWALAAGAFLAGGLGVAGLGLIGTRWIHKFAVFEAILALLPTRLTGLPGAAEGFHPNEVAGGLLWVVPLASTLAAAAVLHGRSLTRVLGGVRGSLLLVFLVAIACFLLGVLMLSQSRGGWIAAALILPVLLLVLVRGKWRWAAALLLSVVIVAAAVWVAAARPDAVSLLVLGPPEDPGRGMSVETFSARVEIWSRAVYGIQDFPLTGMGMNAFRKVVPVLYPLFSIDPATDIGHAHNTFLQAALDLGIPGLIAYLAIHVSAFAMLISSWRRRGRLPFPEPLSSALILGLAGGLAAHMVYGLTDAVALGAKIGRAHV